MTQRLLPPNTTDTINNHRVDLLFNVMERAGPFELSWSGLRRNEDSSIENGDSSI